jgi:hypothetical protein
MGRSAIGSGPCQSCTSWVNDKEILPYILDPKGRGGPDEYRGDTAPQPWQRGRSGLRERA